MSKPQRTYIQGKKADGVRQAAQDSRQEMRIAQAPQAQAEVDALRAQLRRWHVDARRIAELKKLLADVKRGEGITPEQKRRVLLIKTVDEFATEVQRLEVLRKTVSAEARSVEKEYRAFEAGKVDPVTLILAAIALLTSVLVKFDQLESAARAQR